MYRFPACLKEQKQKEVENGFLNRHWTPYEDLNEHVNSLREIITYYIHIVESKLLNTVDSNFELFYYILKNAWSIISCQTLGYFRLLAPSRNKYFFCFCFLVYFYLFIYFFIFFTEFSFS